jgi:para-aminobenzoate synthetase
MYTGMDVLAANLPPRSITGAPEKRSCEILQEMEEYKDKSLYSGVVGYMDFGGSGDFSVNIWCMFKRADGGEEDGACEDMELGDSKKEDTEVWNISTGGAVTALSTPAAEREEMEMKLSGILRVSDISPGK